MIGYNIFRFLPIVFLGLLVLGCSLQPKTVTLSLKADYGGVVRNFKEKGCTLDEIDKTTHYYLCPAYWKLRRYEEFFDCTKRLKPRLEKEGVSIASLVYLEPSAAVIEPLIWEAYVQLELGNYKRSLEFGRQAIKKADSFKGTFGVPAWYFRMPSYGVVGLALALSGHTAEAKEYAKKILETSDSFYTTHEQAITDVAKIYMALGLYDKALEALPHATTAFSQFSKSVVSAFDISFAYIELPRLYMLHKAQLETGRLEEAKEGMNRLLKVKVITENRQLYRLVLTDLGIIAVRENRIDEAIRFFKKAIDLIEEQRSTINTEASKIGFVGDKQQVYQDLIAVLFEKGRFEEAFEYAERGKARALVDMLAAKKQFVGGGVDRVKTASLFKELEEAETKSIYLDYQGGSFEKRASTRALKVTKVNQIAQVSLQLSSLVTVRSLDAKRIQNLLANNETLIEYYYHGDCVFAFVITQGSVHGIKLEGKDLSPEISKFRKQIMNPDSNQFKEHGQNLYENLFQPFEAMLATQNLTIVPHGALHYLPFNSLCSKDGYIIDRYNIRVLPSASVMEFLSGPREGQAGELIAFGNPDLEDRRLDLPFAEAESLAITKGQPNSKVLIRRQATETAAKKFGGQFKCVHFATHGAFNPDIPLKSGLMLSRDSENDGMLTVEELYDLTLNADLVTLSACETALGKVTSGDDVVGFTRGLFYAGANSIVSSLWKVDDRATSILMQHFYENLKNSDKCTALRKAQLEVKNNYNSHPFFWAAFQLTGAVQ